MNIFNIRSKELHLVIILLLMFFSISAASITGSALRDTIFLIKFDRTYLSLMYVLIAIVITIIIEAYKKLIGDKEPISLITYSSGIFAFSLLVIHNNLNGWVIPLLYIWIEAIAIITILQFWMLAGELLNTRQAKRIFPIIIAGGSFAAIGCGYFIKPFVENYGSENLLFITIIFLLLNIIISQLLRPYIVINTNYKNHSETVLPLKNVRLEPYLKHIAIMVGCSAFISRVIDYQFKVMAANTFPLQNELVTFFGTYYMITGAATLLMQFVITSFVLTKLGILVGLIFLPTTLIFGSIGFFILSSLLTVFILKFSDQVFKFSINNAVREILWLPLSRIKKTKLKPIIDGSIKSIVEGFAGLTIFILVTFKFVPESKIYLLSLIVLIFAIYWFWNSFRIKRGYLSEIVNSIEKRQLNLDKIHFDINDSSTLSALMLSLKDENDHKKLFAIDLLWDMPLEPFKKTLQNQFFIGSTLVKRELLNLCWLKKDIITDKMIINQIQRRNDISPYAILCASDRKINKHIKLIKSYIHDSNITLKSSSLVAILKNDSTNFEAIKLINKVLKHGKESEIIELLGFLINANFDIQENLVLHYLESENRYIKSGILKVISHNPKIEYLNSIISLLNDNNVASDAEKTLLKYDKDIACKAILRSFLNAESTNGLKIAILKVIHHFKDKNLIQIIISNISEANLNIANASCNALNKISKNQGLAKNNLNQIEIIINDLSKNIYQFLLFRNELKSSKNTLLLLDHIDDEIRKMKHLILKLGTLNDPTIPIESYLRYVDSKDHNLLPLVLELIDSTFTKNSAKLILPLIDPDFDPTQIAANILGEIVISKEKMLKYWVENSNQWKTNISIKFLLSTKNNKVMEKIDWGKLSEGLINSRYFSKLERDYLSHISNNHFKNKEFHDMYSVLEKTLFLKSVDLFKTIPAETLSNIAQITIEVEKEKDDKIFDEGEHGDSLYIIISGKISVVREQKSIAILEHGNCIGEMSLLDQKPRSAGAIAIEDSILLKIDQEGFYELMSNNPDIMKQIVMILTKRIREMNKKFTDSLQ